MMANALFLPGDVVLTPGALAALSVAGVRPATLLQRHVAGDWGDLTEEDNRANDAALGDGSRIFSSYSLPNGKIWVITEAINEETGQRDSTCILLPSEY